MNTLLPIYDRVTDYDVQMNRARYQRRLRQAHARHCACVALWLALLAGLLVVAVCGCL